MYEKVSFNQTLLSFEPQPRSDDIAFYTVGQFLQFRLFIVVDINEHYFISFTLYSAHSRVGRGKLV